MSSLLNNFKHGHRIFNSFTIHGKAKGDRKLMLLLDEQSLIYTEQLLSYFFGTYLVESLMVIDH